MPRKISSRETRTLSQLKESYLIEKRLALQLRTATKEKRRTLYSQVYDEFFKLVPFDPLLTRKTDHAFASKYVSAQLAILRPFLTRSTRYLEIGAGDCQLSCEVAKVVEKVYALEVSSEIASTTQLPANVELIIFSGIELPVGISKVDLVYSCNVIEHLHPDDFVDQLISIVQALKPKGEYLFSTPHPYNGPHDTTGYFEETASGFHLKEYTIQDRVEIMLRAGFRSVFAVFGARGHYLKIPVWPILVFESLISQMPFKLRRAIAQLKPSQLALGTYLVAQK